MKFAFPTIVAAILLLVNNVQADGLRGVVSDDKRRALKKSKSKSGKSSGGATYGNSGTDRTNAIVPGQGGLQNEAGISVNVVGGGGGNSGGGSVGNFNPSTLDGPGSITATVSGRQDLTKLFRLVASAGLGGTLASGGPFTLFAPVDSALPQGTGLLELQANPALASILTYHVVPGKVMSGDLTDNMVVNTVEGRAVTINTVGGVSLNGGTANVIQADIEATNGVIHLIDGVLMPPDSMETAVEEAETSGSVSGQVTGGSTTTTTTTTTPSVPAPAPTVGSTAVQVCSPAQAADFACDITDTVKGFLACRSGLVACILPNEALTSDTCGCCPGDRSPLCQPDAMMTGVARNGGV